MESIDSSTILQLQQPQLPPGFRFHPTDEELVVHYLKKRAASVPLPVAIIAEVDLYKFDPWELPAKATFGENEWYFFSPRDRKYPNGARPNRAATSGYWKATGIDKPVWTAGGTQKVGVKKALVFYGGKPPKGIKTNWIMHEYRLTDSKSNYKPPTYAPSKNKGSLRLDDWVLCRIYKKSYMQRPAEVDGGGGGGDMTINGILTSPPPWFMKPTGEYNAMVDNHEHNNNILFDNMLNNSNSGENNHRHNTVFSTSDLFPAKRGQFWSQDDDKVNSSSSATASAMDTDLQLQLQQQTMLLGPGESMFPVPEMNWYS